MHTRRPEDRSAGRARTAGVPEGGGALVGWDSSGALAYCWRSAHEQVDVGTLAARSGDGKLRDMGADDEPQAVDAYNGEKVWSGSRRCIVSPNAR